MSIGDKMQTVRVIILHCDLDECNRGLLSSVASRAGICIEFRAIEQDLPRLPIRDPYTSTIFGRFLVGELCSEKRTVLYLDSDCLVVEDLATLGSVDMNDAAVGAVHDLLLPSNIAALVDAPDLIARETDYFNSGVLLINIINWKKERVHQRTFDIILRHGHRLHFPDQDALNIVLEGEWVRLDRRWNVFPFREILAGGRIPYRGESHIPFGGLQTLQDEARILHFTSPLKPWHSDYPDGPNAAMYRNYIERVNGITLPSSIPATSHEKLAPLSHAATDDSRPTAAQVACISVARR
jgi:lipopolysaccharide biosynthesis glycosyltransferase